MSAKLPRSTKAAGQMKLGASSEESGRKKKTRMGGTSLNHQFSGKSKQELTRGDHPWSGAMEALLRPLPPDWRHNIQQVFSSIGEALGNLLGGQQGERRVPRGRRPF